MNEKKQRSFFLSSLPFFILAHATHHLLTALPQPMQPFMQDEHDHGYRYNAAQDAEKITRRIDAERSRASQRPGGS